MRSILLLTHDFPPRRGGVARYLHDVAVHFDKDIFVVAPPEPGSETQDMLAPYPVQREELLGHWIWPRWIKIVFFLLKNKDRYQTILVSHVLPVGTAAWMASFWTRKPFVVILHGLDFALADASPVKRFLLARILTGARTIVTNSESLHDEVLKKYRPKQAVVLHPCPSHVPTEEGHPIPGELITVARLVERKGHLRILEALVRLRNQHRLKSLRYRILGDGPMREVIRQRIREWNLEDIVSMETNASDKDVQRAYETADLFVMPTVQDPIDREGFGLVYLEAAAYGIPSIGTDQPGVREAVIHEKTGVLVPDGDIGALAETIVSLVSDRSRRAAMGKEAKSRVLECFNSARICEKLRPYL